MASSLSDNLRNLSKEHRTLVVETLMVHLRDELSVGYDPDEIEAIFQFFLEETTGRHSRLSRFLSYLLGYESFDEWLDEYSSSDYMLEVLEDRLHLEDEVKTETEENQIIKTEEPTHV